MISQKSPFVLEQKVAKRVNGSMFSPPQSTKINHKFPLKRWKKMCGVKVTNKPIHLVKRMFSLECFLHSILIYAEWMVRRSQIYHRNTHIDTHSVAFFLRLLMGKIFSKFVQVTLVNIDVYGFDSMGLWIKWSVKEQTTIDLNLTIIGWDVGK